MTPPPFRGASLSVTVPDTEAVREQPDRITKTAKLRLVTAKRVRIRRVRVATWLLPWRKPATGKFRQSVLEKSCARTLIHHQHTYQSEPRTSPPAGVRAAFQVETLTPA